MWVLVAVGNADGLQTWHYVTQEQAERTQCEMAAANMDGTISFYVSKVKVEPHGDDCILRHRQGTQWHCQTHGCVTDCDMTAPFCHVGLSSNIRRFIAQ